MNHGTDRLYLASNHKIANIEYTTPSHPVLIKFLEYSNQHLTTSVTVSDVLPGEKILDIHIATIQTISHSGHSDHCWRHSRHQHLYHLRETKTPVTA